MNNNNITNKVEWAEIAAHYLAANQMIAYGWAMKEYRAYDTRDCASQWAVVQQAFNRQSPPNWKVECHEVTTAYRKMVRANIARTAK